MLRSTSLAPKSDSSTDRWRLAAAGGGIRQLVDNWAVWRDAGDWARFRTVWHSGGVMMATWFQGAV